MYIQQSNLGTQAAAFGLNSAMHQEATLQCIRRQYCNEFKQIPCTPTGPDLQVRQLQSIGFGVSRDILAEVDTANKFYRHGLLLKQVVNFYNNSATEIIPCQKPMLLQVRPTAKSVAEAHVCCLLMQSLPNLLQSTPPLHPFAEALLQALILDWLTLAEALPQTFILVWPALVVIFSL